jgi:hypothetical protein
MVRTRLAVPAIILAATTGFAGGLLTGNGLASRPAPPPSPRACTRPALPSGDVARAGGTERVCTDGTWVRVTGYGN